MIQAPAMGMLRRHRILKATKIRQANLAKMRQ
ncbi:Uncharacterised protein [Vibrio cholerae]|nr:Uncharacterised protein [Vibrio cholerae]